MEWVWLNGDVVPKPDAKISVFDRGFLFADAVYEVTAVLDGHLIDFEDHFERLKRSCHELDLVLQMGKEDLRDIHQQLIVKNKLEEGVIYLQLTGGIADRNFIIDRSLSLTMLLFSQSKDLIHNPKVKTGQHIITVEDMRWQRRDIKTTQLLSQSLARTQAINTGADDAWLVTDGLVNEGCSSNAFIVTPAGRLVTRPSSHEILSGITRQAIFQCAQDFNLEVEHRPFSVGEAQTAKEAFSTSASTFVMPVTEIDGVKIGNGKPGRISLHLRELYIERALKA